MKTTFTSHIKKCKQCMDNLLKPCAEGQKIMAEMAEMDKFNEERIKLYNKIGSDGVRKLLKKRWKEEKREATTLNTIDNKE